MRAPKVQHYYTFIASHSARNTRRGRALNRTTGIGIPLLNARTRLGSETYTSANEL